MTKASLEVEIEKDGNLLVDREICKKNRCMFYRLAGVKYVETPDSEGIVKLTGEYGCRLEIPNGENCYL